MSKKNILPLLGLLFVLTAIYALKENQTPAWMNYQKKYFAEQIQQVETEISVTTDPKQKQALQVELQGWEKRQPQIVNLVLPNGKVERCQTCHLGTEEISPSHPVNTFGCVVCHGGNPLSLDENTAHAGWYGQGHPGSLTTVTLSCGGPGPNGESCHAGNPNQADNQVDLVKSSIMSTKAGELSFVRRMFGLDPGKTVPGLKQGQTAETYPSPLGGMPQQQQFIAGCLTQCHQDNGQLPLFALPKNHPIQLPQGQFPNGAKAEATANGCEACHVLTNPTHTYVGQDVTIPRNQIGFGMVHKLTTQIPYTQCNQCHNQGQHDPIHMKFTPRVDLQKVINDWQSPNLTWKDRVKDYYVPGEVFAKCEVSLDCIDCHTRQDVMGDGHFYQSEYDAVHIQCMDCHGTLNSLPLTKTITSNKDLAFEEQTTNPVFPALKTGDKIVVTHKGEEMPFIRYSDGSWKLWSRVTGKEFNIPLVEGSQCLQDPNDQSADSCHKCHQSTANSP